MIDRFRLFLGPARLRALFILIAVTGLASLMLNVVIDDYDWVRPVQSLLALIALVGAVVIIGGRLDPAERGRWSAILMPAIGALILAGTVLTDFALPLIGAALGWIVAGLFLFRAKMPMAYQKAIRALRKADYETAVKVMDQIIKEEPDNPGHYRFRAELLRLWGKLDRARRDYVRITELDPESAVGFNGLAEVSLQAGDFRRAHEAALRAAALAPDDWVALYNLGMIEDRLRDSAAAIEHLSAALEQKVPDARHRLLIHLYLLRAYARTNQPEAAAEQLKKMQRLRSGLEEWQKILADDQAATLRAVLGADVELATELIAGRMPIEAAAE